MSAVQLLVPPGDDDFLAHCIVSGETRVVSLVGAGGKTSTVFWLANVLQRRGARVLISTTTRMQFPDSRFGSRCLVDPDFPVRLAYAAARTEVPCVTAVFSTFDERLQKVTGCLPAEIDALKAAGVADVILVEADGAHHRLIKVPAAHEPCIPASSDVVIALTGGEALLRPAQASCIHRWAEFKVLTGVTDGDLLDESVLHRLLSDPSGMFKNSPAGAHRHWLINAHSTVDSDVLAMLESLIKSHPELDSLWLGNMRNPNPFMRGWVRNDRMQRDN